MDISIKLIQNYIIKNIITNKTEKRPKFDWINHLMTKYFIITLISLNTSKPKQQQSILRSTTTSSMLHLVHLNPGLIFWNVPSAINRARVIKPDALSHYNGAAILQFVPTTDKWRTEPFPLPLRFGFPSALSA